MIKFSKNIIDEWKNKIVFAPNGFGKTVNANEIYNYYNKKNKNIAIYTRRSIQNLVTTYDDILLLGKTGTYKKENLDLEKKFKNSKELTDFVSNKYNAKNATEMRDKSFLFNFCNITNLSKIEVISNKLLILKKSNFNNAFNFTLEDCIKLDGVLNVDLYKIILNILSENKPEQIDVANDEDIIFDDLKDCFNSISKIVTVYKLDKCPLCGTEFKSNEELCEKINATIARYGTNKQQSLIDIINNTYIKCKVLLSDIKKIIKIDFPQIENEDKIDYEYHIFEFVKEICESTISVLVNNIYSFKLDDKTFAEISEKYNENQNKINTESDALSKDSLLSQEMVEEYLKIVNPTSEIEVLPSKIGAGIEFELNGKKVKDPYEVLSESEMKRLALVVLRKTVELESVSYIIFDDPIDSYDDYYLVRACRYICDILQLPKICGWYLTTNNYQALFNICDLLKCDSIVYSEDPKIIFNGWNVQNKGSVDKPVYFNATADSVKKINKNELYLLNQFVTYEKNLLRFNNQLAFLAFTNTIRNFKEIVLVKHDNSGTYVGNYNVSVVWQKEKTNVDFANIVSDKIEHLLMHYDSKDTLMQNLTSYTLSNADVYKIYEILLKIDDKSGIYDFKNDATRAINLRKKALYNRAFNHKNDDELLNLIFFKIVLISDIKFMFEKALIDKLQSKYFFSNDDIEKIINKNGLWNKISVAEKINNSNHYGADTFISGCRTIHEEYCSIYNAFDHGLALMLPPYLSTSIRDLAKFKESVDQLIKTY